MSIYVCMYIYHLYIVSVYMHPYVGTHKHIHTISDGLQNVYFLIKLSFLSWYFLGTIAIPYRISMHGWYMSILFIFVFILFIILFSSHEPQHLNVTTGFLSGIFLCAWGRFLTRSSARLKVF